MNKQHFKDAVSFGRALIRTRDLDPVYVALAEAGLGERALHRTLLAYFCLYHLGAAVYIGSFDSCEFWAALETAAINKDLAWPRGAERRHWRGAAAKGAVRWLRDNFEDNPSGVLYRWYNGAKATGRAAPTFTAVSAEVRRAASFGPWIAFKVADMMERVAKLPVDFSDCALGVYREPRAGAALLLTGNADCPIYDEELAEVVEALLCAPGLHRLHAPPHGDRYLNVQEAETILCKYKSYVNGRYPVGKDTREVLHALLDPRWMNKTGRMRFALERLL